MDKCSRGTVTITFATVAAVTYSTARRAQPLLKSGRRVLVHLISNTLSPKRGNHKVRGCIRTQCWMLLKSCIIKIKQSDHQWFHLYLPFHYPTIQATRDLLDSEVLLSHLLHSDYGDMVHRIVPAHRHSLHYDRWFLYQLSFGGTDGMWFPNSGENDNIIFRKPLPIHMKINMVLFINLFLLFW